MNCVDCKEILVEYFEGLLDESRKQEVAKHLNDCSSCKAELITFQALEERLVKNGKALGQCNLETKVLNKIMREQRDKLKAADKTGSHIETRRIIRKSLFIKIAAAAVLVLGLFTISQFGVSSVAWGEVVEKVQSAKSFIYHITVSANISESEQVLQMDVHVYSSSDYGSRIENYTDGELNSINIMKTKENSFITIMPREKIYLESPLSQEQIDEMTTKQDPRQIIRQMLAANYTKLGRDILNGIEVESIEATGQTALGGTIKNATARLWVERGTDFPVLLQIDGLAAGSNSKISMVVKDFQWNTTIPQSLFVPDIPADYTSIETEN
ncbi:zf-HC2 domain-containing protein [Planctomycetota bacterium]